MTFRFEDPKPHLPDTAQWTSMLSEAPAELRSMLWTCRDMGTVIQHGKLVPLIHPGSGWESVTEFNQIAVPHLKPYAAKIKTLIERAMEDVSAQQNGSASVRTSEKQIRTG